MRLSLARITPIVCLSLLAASPALAQRRDESIECYRDGRRVSCESTREERERALARAREARERADEIARDARLRADENRRRLAERQREQQRERAEMLRRDAERRRDIERERQRVRDRELDRALRQRRRWYDESRTTVGIGGGADIRRFSDVNRYFTNASVDFRSRSGIGVRPEVLYAWSDRQRVSLPVYVSTCPTCSFIPPVVSGTAPLEIRTRSQMLGVNVNGTYTFLRGSMVRPYLLGGVGVLSTRETRPIVTSSVPLASTPTFQQVTYSTTSDDRVNLGLNAGSGLEFGRGPVRLYVEFRYFLNDAPSTQGFSGALPITAGLRF